MGYACDRDFILVTNNAADFRRLYGGHAVHPGLVIFIPNVNVELQQELFRAALEQLAVHGEPVNRLLEVDLDGEEVVFDFSNLSASD